MAIAGGCTLRASQRTWRAADRCTATGAASVHAAAGVRGRAGRHMQACVHTFRGCRRTDAVPFGRMGRAEDLTGMAVFLASDDASYVVAQTYNVDGGNWMS